MVSSAYNSRFDHRTVAMIPYQAFSEHLQKLNVLASPSELQAHATAMLSVHHDMAYETWAGWVNNEYCVEGATSSGLDVVLMAVFDMTKDQLNKDDFSFELLLPNSEPSISGRLSVLVDWVNTYLSALGLAGFTGKEGLTKDALEFIQDLNQIARVEQDANDTEGEELDLMEIVEYVRTGVMVVHGELNQFQPADDTLN